MTFPLNPHPYDLRTEPEEALHWQPRRPSTTQPRPPENRPRDASSASREGPSSPVDVADPTIRYGQCWEDADVLVKGLDVQPGDTCLSIGSAGDNALALLTQDPEKVVAVDLNRAQISCLALRVAAYRSLTHRELLELVGSRPSDRRDELYSRCRPALDAATRVFWDYRPELIRQGIGAAGRFERYFRIFRTTVLPLCHSRRRVDALLTPRTRSERERFYEDSWSNARWQVLMRLFCSETVMKRLGRDPQFFEHVDSPIAGRLLRRIRRTLTELDPAENPYLQWILTGEHRTARPLALRKEHLDTIRDNLDRLTWERTSLEDYLRAAPSASIDRFNLSDVFEYVSPEHTRDVLREVARTARTGGRAAYWNVFVDRERPAELAPYLHSKQDLADRLHQRDKAIFYRRFVLEERSSASLPT